VSGIVGMYDRSGAPVDRALLQDLTHFVSYRGPDARDTWSRESVGLGHTMLRTTAPSKFERQPANLGHLWITADARIDCRDELKSKLLEADGAFALKTPATDSDLISQSYAAWGADCVQHLRGDFAFAIWDARKKLLFCARDHFGIKPFYYCELGEVFVFSNTLNCLRQHPDVSDELNDAAVGDFLLFGLNCESASTTFRDIRRLPAAHAMTVSSEGLRIQRYWSAPTEGRIRYQRAEDYVEHFQILLHAAVADRITQERAGIFLSGGLDSAAVAGTARELSGCGADLRAYTVVYESLIPDQDGPHAREVAEFLKIPIQCIAMDRLRPFERWNEPEVSSPEPVEDPFLAGMFDQFRTISKDCRTVLSGEGADNLMHFEMWPFAKDMIRRREWGSLIAQSLRYFSVRPSIVPGLKRRARNVFGTDPLAPVYPKWLAPDFARRLNLKGRAKEWNELPAHRPHPVLPIGHASMDLPHWAHIFEREDPGVTGLPVEVRYPFLDLRIVNFLLALPPFPWFFEKKLLREAMIGGLPERVRTRRKTPLAGNPLAEHIRQLPLGWMNQVDWEVDMDSYIDKSRVAAAASATNAHADMTIRPLCLNFWLQSARGVRYNFRAEVRNA